MPNKYKYFISLFIFLAFFISCSAPRNNPLDPENPDNNISTIEGYIKMVNLPQDPIEGAKIFWINDEILTQSDQNGYFKIENIERKNGWLKIEKIGYSIDSVMIDFGGRKKVSTDIYLNAIPQIIELYFYSITINKFPTTQKYNLEVIARITDNENDIDSVFIENAELEVKEELLYDASQKYYKNSLSLEDLNITSIDIVIGKEFHINVSDLNGNKFNIGKPNIKRIIKEEIETTTPSGRDTVLTGNPVLQWRRFTPGFEYSYLVQIYTDEVQPLLMWEKELSSVEIQYETDANLTSGDYFWVIWAIDEFKNRTRSKPSSFIVK